MYQVKVVYDNNKDKELLSQIDTTVPFFLYYIDMNTTNGRKAGFKLLNYWSAKKLPFVVIEDEDPNVLPIVKYSEIGENAINQLIKFINANN